MEETLKLILNRLDTLQADVNDMKTEMTVLRKDITHLTKQLDLTASHVLKHTEKLEKLSIDIEYLTQRDYQTQKDLFVIKRNLKFVSD